MKFKEELKDLLNNNKRFVSDGKILKNKVVELALKLDKDLIKLLLSNEIIKEHFFIDVDETLIFDKEKFISNNINILFLKPHEITYNQKRKPFEPWLSIIDVLMFNGKDETVKLLNYFSIAED